MRGSPPAHRTCLKNASPSRPLKRRIAALVVAAALSVPAAAYGATAASPCNPSLARKIPARRADAPSGSEFARRVAGLGEADREAAIADELLAGNIPDFLRRPVAVAVSGARAGGDAVAVTLCVLPDYLAIGTDEDFLLMPMRLETALAVGARYGFVLPTSKMVDAIYAQSAVHLAPQPLPASERMRSTAYYRYHSEIVEQQRAAFAAPLGALTAGGKKDLVLTNLLWRNPDRVAIYGWHRGNTAPIQPLSTVHGWRYADYSHGVRLVSAVAYANGERRSLVAMMEDPALAPVLNREGPIPRLAALLDRLRANKTTVPDEPAAPTRTAAYRRPDPHI